MREIKIVLHEATNGVAMLDDSNEIRVFMFSCIRTKIIPAEYNSLIVIS